jgi:hypothetical protein
LLTTTVLPLLFTTVAVLLLGSVDTTIPPSLPELDSDFDKSLKLMSALRPEFPSSARLDKSKSSSGEPVVLPPPTSVPPLSPGVSSVTSMSGLVRITLVTP